MLATVPEADVEAALDVLADAGIEAGDIGAVRAADEPSLLLNDERFTEPEREALYSLWDEE